MAYRHPQGGGAITISEWVRAPGLSRHMCARIVDDQGHVELWNDKSRNMISAAVVHVELYDDGCKKYVRRKNQRGDMAAVCIWPRSSGKYTIRRMALIFHILFPDIVMGNGGRFFAADGNESRDASFVNISLRDVDDPDSIGAYRAMTRSQLAIANRERRECEQKMRMTKKNLDNG